jgi:hypothetical protein
MMQKQMIAVSSEVRRMFGHDLPWWVDTMNVIYLWMLAIGAGAAIAIALTSWFIIKWQGEIQRGKDIDFEKYKLETKVKTDQLERETADANARALETKLELAKLRTPRIITPEQQSRIAEKIKPFSGIAFDLAVVSSDQDTVDLLPTIEDALTQGGWKPIAWVGGAILYDRARSKRVMAGVVTARGVNVLVDPEQIPNLLPAAEALSAALNAEDIGARAAANTDSSLSENKTAIHVIVGTKP